MRIALYCLIGLLVLCAAAIAWPYRYETLAQTVVANPTGCIVQVEGGDRRGEQLFPGIVDSRLIDPVHARFKIFGCPVARGVGTPAAVTLASGGRTYLGEDCGDASERASMPCHVDFPAGVGHHRLLIQLEDGGLTQSVVIDVRRERTWRSRLLDSVLTV